MSDTEEFFDDFAITSPLPPGAMGPKKLAVVRYKGKREKPRWVDLEPGQCNILTATSESLILCVEQKITRLCAT